VKLSARRAGLAGEEVSFILCPLTPPTTRGLRGAFQSNGLGKDARVEHPEKFRRG
jgi:hypothetical protein